MRQQVGNVLVMVLLWLSILSVMVTAVSEQTLWQWRLSRIVITMTTPDESPSVTVLCQDSRSHD